MIEYFYVHDSAKTSAKPQPTFLVPLIRLRDYFGVDGQNVRRTVQNFQEYKNFVADAVTVEPVGVTDG